MFIRFAPAASGKLHIGNLRILLINYFICLHFNLPYKILLRLDFQNDVTLIQEDEMSNYVQKLFIIFSINMKLEIVKQRNRFDRYYEILDQLYVLNYVYDLNNVTYLNIKQLYSDNYVIRFNDLLLGRMYKQICYINNPIIYSKSKKLFFYNFMSVIDDIDFGIKYIVRGNDHIDNTYVQILIFEILQNVISFQIPNFLHVPMCVTKFGKISKSSIFDFSIQYFLKQFIFPEVLQNYLVNFNYNISSIGKSQKVIDVEEILRLNIKYLRKSNSSLIVKSFMNVWNVMIDIMLVDIFKSFVKNVNDLIKINQIIFNFKNKNFLINYEQKKIILYLYQNNMLNDLYKYIGNIFHYEYLGKEFIEYLKIDSIIN